MDLFIDTEFTGNRLLQVALVDEEDRVVYHTLVRPENLDFDAQWRITSKIHRIRPKDVQDAPSVLMVQRRILELCAGHRVIGYAVGADARHFPLLKQAANVVCAMKAYKEHTRQTQGVKLAAALQSCGIDWSFGRAHGALADAQATRALWLWLQAQKRQDALRRFDAQDGPVSATPIKLPSPADQARAMAERFAPLARARQKPARPVDPQYPNKGMPWMPDDSQWVQTSWQQGVSVQKMSQHLGRTPGAIVARIVHLGLADDADIVRSIDAGRHAVMVTPQEPAANALAA